MRAFLRTALGLVVVTGVLVGALASSDPAEAATKKSFRIAWSIYVGWMPWAYAAETGIMKKWAAKYGIEIELVQVKDYIESINQYTAGAFRWLRHDEHGRADDPRCRRCRFIRRNYR